MNRMSLLLRALHNDVLSLTITIYLQPAVQRARLNLIVPVQKVVIN